MISIIDLLKAVEEYPPKFLSLGLILRGMFSDIINYRYLRQVHDIIGMDLFKNELAVMLLNFVKALRKIVDNEKQMAEGDKETEKNR